VGKRPFTICVLGARGVPGVAGGVEAHCEALMPRLAALRPEARFVVLARKAYVREPRYTFAGVDVVALPAPKHRYLEAFVHTLRGVLHARFAEGARIVHLHAIGPALFAPLARLLGMRVIVTHHSRNYLHAKWNAVARAALRFGEWCAATCADRVIAVSPSLAEEMRRRYRGAARKISYIPNGATEFPPPGRDEDEAAILARLGVAPGGYIIAVGRLTPEKGLHDLIPAYEKAAPPRKLLIVGRADFEDDYSRALMAHASDKIIFAGFQDRATLRTLYANAALFVMPSHHEGMPIAALEALSCNAPILMSDIEPNRDLALPGVCYFPMGDADALAAKLACDPSVYAVDARAMLKAFSWAEVARQTGAVYDGLIAPRVSPAAAPAL
jgi:glycosyltransferase involved in cell wall biosynthesis